MSTLNLFQLNKFPTLKRFSFFAGVAITALTTAHNASASCTYQIDNEWASGYVASILLKNDTAAAVNNWSVNWQYTTNRITGSWNANLSGTNPYTATNMSWNGNLAVGQSISFGFQVAKNGTTTERPQINGTLCRLMPISSSSVPVVSSARSSFASASVLSSRVSSSSSQLSSVQPSSARLSSLGLSSARMSSSVASSTPTNPCPSEIKNAFQMLAPRIPATVQAEDFDPAGYSDSTTANEGTAYRTDTGVDIKTITNGNAVGWMTNGEWLEYTVYVESEGDYDLTIRSAAVGSGRTFKISQCNTTLVEAFKVPSVNNWGEFKTWSAGKIHLKPGYQKVRVTVGATDYADLDWIHIGPYSGIIDMPNTDPNASEGCGKARTLQNGRINLNVNNVNRSYILRVPDNYNNQNPYRLIIGYHWRGGDAAQVANGGNGSATETPHYGLWNLAQNSTIFIAPEGIDQGWANTGGRDLALTDAILSQVQSNLCIDKSRIFANGFSYGAGMSNAVACARPNVFRGVALYSGAQLSGCDGGTSPVAFFAAHGLDDTVLNISMGRTVRDRFVRNNQCTAQNPIEPARGSGTHICTSYQGCLAGKPVRWCAFDGGHWPSQHDAGRPESWIPVEAWNFISQF
ncbi:MAG: cellulose binding domain-containing protein [Pseudomonadota bacterium]